MKYLSDESNFDEKEDYYDTESTHSSERTRSESDHTPSRDEESDSDSHSDDSRLCLDTALHESGANVERSQLHLLPFSRSGQTLSDQRSSG
jgi:hypothetical protein